MQANLMDNVALTSGWNDIVSFYKPIKPFETHFLLVNITSSALVTHSDNYFYHLTIILSQQYEMNTIYLLCNVTM